MHETYCHGERRFGVFRIFGLTIGGLVLAGLLALTLGWLLQYLWNVIPAALFHWPTITYWQAVGLFMLAKLVFGGVGPHGGHHHHHGRGYKRWRRHGRDWAGGWHGHEMFHRFWEEEGREAFEAYMGRKQKE